MSNRKNNPVDDYLLEKNAARDQKDLQAWQAWKADPTPDNLQPLMQRFDSVFSKTQGRLKAPNVNPTAFRANMMGHALEAFNKFDPNRGASLRTFVTGTVQNRAQRFNTQQQNLAHIPEAKAGLIGPIDKARDELTEQLGRAPSFAEIGSHIGKPAKLVQEIQGLRRADISASAFESDPVSRSGSRHDEVVGLLRSSLANDEQAVFDYMYGQNGKPTVTSTGQIAQRLGKSPSQISRIRRRIETKYKSYV